MNDLEKRMLSVVDSDHTRKYLEKDHDFNIHDWVELVISAPKPMDLKIELLREMQGSDMASEDHKGLDHLNKIIDAAETAMDRLYHMNPERSVVLITDYDSAYPDPYVMGDGNPARSYEEALEVIRHNYLEEDERLEDLSDLEDYYITMTLYDVVDGAYKEQITYYCVPNGKVYYFDIARRSGSERIFNEWFSGSGGLESWMTPYKPGDILYVDMRPWYRATYCLVYWVSPDLPWDCCGIQCLYPVFDGMVGNGAFKHGRFLPYIRTAPYCMERPFFSPLYRAEPYDGELPEEYAFMKPLSEGLKSDPAMSQRIDDFLMNECVKGSQDTVYVYRPVSVKRMNRADEPECDAIWHPDCQEQQWWEDGDSKDGVEKAKIFKAAGLDKTQGR